MSPKTAERLTGYEVRRLRDRDCTGQTAYGAFRGDELIAEAAHRTEALALRILVGEVYKIHCLEVLRRSGGRCSRCHGHRRLQIHHRTYRSHGGTHRTENLEPVCWDCHKMIHKLERSK
jgi:5-methylcytosine-specific restriction endonuclease McrA